MEDISKNCLVYTMKINSIPFCFWTPLTFIVHKNSSSKYLPHKKDKRGREMEKCSFLADL